MPIKQYLDYRLFGIIGSVFLIISEFLPWLSGISLLDVYILFTLVAIEEAFLYLFPLMSGIICLFASTLLIYDEEYRINSVIINIIGLSFLSLFLFEFIPGELTYIASLEIGFYFCVAGFLFVIFDIIHILISSNQQYEGRE